MADLFEEVEEQLRSDRYKALALKAAPYVAAVLAAALVVALGVWGWGAYVQSATNKASETYNQALETYQQGNAVEGVRLWTEVSKSRSRVYKSLALMHLAGAKSAENKTDEAVKLWDEAAKAAPDPIIGDAARLKSALALLDTAPYKDVEGRLTPLMEDGHPYRAQAREALAFAKLRAGDTAGAKSDFVVLSALLGASDGARERANAAIALIDSGSAKALPGAVKAAIALPPPARFAPPAGPQLQAPGPQ